MLNKIDKKKIVALLISFILGALFITVFSYSTSKVYPYYFGSDSAQFLTIGKAWYLGKIPYIDMFDHKGPVVFFVDMLGFWLGRGNKSGVSIIQFIFMCFTLAGAFEISQLIKKSNVYGIFSVIVTLAAMRMNYMEGNAVEEYCLPFLFWSAYGLLKWYRGERKEHDFKWTFLYGITAGVCFLTRVTNVVTICGGILIICIYLIRYKYFKNLLQNALSFIVGFFAISLPFIIYLQLKAD